jgi:hypothetical protein
VLLPFTAVLVLDNRDLLGLALIKGAAGGLAAGALLEIGFATDILDPALLRLGAILLLLAFPAFYKLLKAGEGLSAGIAPGKRFGRNRSGGNLGKFS